MSRNAAVKPPDGSPRSGWPIAISSSTNECSIDAAPPPAALRRTNMIRLSRLCRRTGPHKHDDVVKAVAFSPGGGCAANGTASLIMLRVVPVQRAESRGQYGTRAAAAHTVAGTPSTVRDSPSSRARMEGRSSPGLRRRWQHRRELLRCRLVPRLTAASRDGGSQACAEQVA